MKGDFACSQPDGEPDKTGYYMTARECRTVDRLIRFLNVAFDTISVTEPFQIEDVDGDPLGCIGFNADQDSYVFRPEMITESDAE